MFDLVAKLFDTSDFPARWNCGNWSTPHGITHIVSDLAIFGAYAAIPCALAYFVIRRRDVPFLPIFWLFVAFIAFCGLGHLVEATIFWHPWYRFSALIKVCTALVSWATVLALLPVLPKALGLPGLAQVNQQLVAEIAERESTEAKLRQSHSELQDFSRVALEREERVMELKAEVNALLNELGRGARYDNRDADGVVPND